MFLHLLQALQDQCDVEGSTRRATHRTPFLLAGAAKALCGGFQILHSHRCSLEKAPSRMPQVLIDRFVHAVKGQDHCLLLDGISTQSLLGSLC